MNASVTEYFRWKLWSHLDPRNHLYETEDEVPDYLNQAIDIFKVGLLVEFVIFLLKGKPIQIYYAFSSATSGVMMQVSLVLVKPAIFTAFSWVYQNFRLITLPWNSLWTWFLVLILVDFAYYWLHRASHEINFLWATHQMHHSAEDFNFSTALRKGILQFHVATLIYLPLALAVPPSLFMVHDQFSLFYQFWIHTKLIGSLGPLEYVLNTPSHHRVHHGRNPYCIDKNYGGIFIIWDRMFGTFAAESEEVAYGLVLEQSSSDWVWLQAGHYIALCKRVYNVKSMKERFLICWRKPSWKTDSEKKGLSEKDLMVPEVEQPIRLRDLKKHSLWLLIYVLAHFFLSVQPMAFSLCVSKDMSRREFWSLLSFVCLGSSSLGFLLDKKWYASHAEIFRCAALVLAQKSLSFAKVSVPGRNAPVDISQYLHILSIALMTLRIFVEDADLNRIVESETSDQQQTNRMKKSE